MSWDASFDGDYWNYTHNTSCMIYEALALAVQEKQAPDAPSWWRQLSGLTGREGAAYLGLIIEVLEACPERFRAMNPANGWGSYDGLLPVLREMRLAGEGACCDAKKWRASG